MQLGQVVGILLDTYTHRYGTGEILELFGGKESIYDFAYIKDDGLWLLRRKEARPVTESADGKNQYSWLGARSNLEVSPDNPVGDVPAPLQLVLPLRGGQFWGRPQDAWYMSSVSEVSRDGVVSVRLENNCELEDWGGGMLTVDVEQRLLTSVRVRNYEVFLRSHEATLPDRAVFSGPRGRARR